MVTVFVHGQPVHFEVDSDAASTLLGEETLRATWPYYPPVLQKPDVHLSTWSGQVLTVLGSATVTVRHKGIVCNLPLLVVRGDGASLLGRNWFAPLGIKAAGVLHTLTSKASLQQLLDKFPSVFNDDLTGCTDIPVHLELLEGATPKLLEGRPVPFAMRSAVEAELDRLEAQSILKPTQHSEWATPLVLVRKSNDQLRLSGDYHSTVNAATRKAVYPCRWRKKL